MSGRMAAIEGEYQKSQEGSGGKFDFVNTRALERLGIKQLKPVVGDNFWRIISPKFSRYPANQIPFYGREVHIHYNVGADRRTFICMRKTANKPCPICEYADQIRAQNSEDKRLQELYASRRYIFFVYNVKDTSTEAEGLHWVDAPGSIKDAIVQISRDRRTGNFIDISERENGADIEFTRIGSKVNTRYEGFKLSNNGTPPEQWYQNVPDDFEEFILWPEYDTVYREVFGGSPAAGQDNSPPVQDPPSLSPTATGSVPTRNRQQAANAPMQEAYGTQQAPVQDPDPAPEQAPMPAPAPQQSSPAPAPAARQPAPTAAPTRDRGNSSAPASGVSPDVQARINQLRQGGGQQ